jgi:hypothetical protein
MAKQQARGDNFRGCHYIRDKDSVPRIQKPSLAEEMQHEDSVRHFRRSLDRDLGSGLLLD